MLTTGVWFDLVSKMSHHMKRGSVKTGLGTRGLRIVAAFGPASYDASPALDCSGYTGFRHSPTPFCTVLVLSKCFKNLSISYFLGPPWSRTLNSRQY